MVAETIAAPIEQQVDGVGATLVESESLDDGSYALTVRFPRTTDLDAARALVQKRVDLALPVLPDKVRARGVTVQKVPDGSLTFWVTVTPGIVHPLALTDVARTLVKDGLARLPGVFDLRVIGDQDLVWLLSLDPAKLAARNVGAAEVEQVLRARKLRVAAGQADTLPEGGELLYTMFPPGRLSDTTDLDGLAVGTGTDGKPVLLRDVGRVTHGRVPNGFAQVNEDDGAIVLAVTAWPGKLTAADVRTALGGLGNLPHGVRADLVDVSAGGFAVVKLRIPNPPWGEPDRRRLAAAKEMIRALLGAPECVAFGDEREPDVATMFVKLPEPGPQAVAGVRKALLSAGPLDVEWTVSEVRAGRQPFPVRIAICDTENRAGLDEIGGTVVKRLVAESNTTDVSARTSREWERYEVTLDNTRLKELGVKPDDAARAIRSAFGGGRDEIDDTPRHGIVTRLDPKGFRVPGRPPADLKDLKVRTAKGELVGLDSAARTGRVFGQRVLTRVNMYPAVILTANPPAGTTPADAAARCVELAERDTGGLYRVDNLTRPER